jgi:hypothetical protein
VLPSKSTRTAPAPAAAVEQSLFLPQGDAEGIERVLERMIHDRDAGINLADRRRRYHEPEHHCGVGDRHPGRARHRGSAVKDSLRTPSGR